ncbi:MAG: M48 family metalloprotease [Dokdonella sp.]
MNKLNWLPMLAVAVCATLVGAREPAVRLPDIGSSAAGIMSPTDQKDYGASMLHQMRAYNMVLDDPLINDYMHALGYRLVSFSDRPDLSFTFFVVRDNDINAFAAPGGYIGTNVGLITAMATEDELAAVIGHEIAHVTQQHLLRAFEDSKKNALPIALAMIGAVVASRNRTDDATEAAVIGGMSLIQQRAINFTRYDEIEADRVGIQTLAKAGFDPLAMAETFATMQRMMRINGVDVPEFLRTHPVDTNRIADAKARAEQLTASQRRKEEVSTRASDSTPSSMGGLRLSLPTEQTAHSVAAAAPAVRDGHFELMRERARVLNAESNNTMLRYYTDNLRDDPKFDTPANHYGHALALIRSRQPQAAATVMKKLVAAHPTTTTFQLGLAEAEDQAGNKAEALQRYERLSTNYPGNRAVSLAFADALLASAEKKSAQRAQELLRPLLTRYAEDPDLQRSFARACELSGDTVRASEAYAETTFLNGRAEDALNQLKTLAERTDLTYYQRARVDARITDMTPVVLELRKRGMQESNRFEATTLAPSICVGSDCSTLSSQRNNSRLQ